MIHTRKFVFALLLFALIATPALATIVETNGNFYSMAAPAYSVVTGDWYSAGTQKQISLDGKTITFTYESEGLAYYNANLHLFYYVLTKPDGTQEILKQYQWDERNEKSSVEIKDPYYSSGTRTHSFSNVKLPEQNFEINISGRGHYKVELKQLSIPRILLDKNQKAEYNLDDILNNWTTENIRYSGSYYSYSCWGPDGGYACIMYVPDSSWSNTAMCSLENPTGNITLKEISSSSSKHCGWELGENSRGRPNCKPSSSGSTDCNAIGMNYSETSVCKFVYSGSSSGSGYGTGSSTTNNYCFIERSQFQQLKVSDLGSNAIWSTEFDVKPVLTITDIKACGDLNCETNPSMRPNEKMFLFLETSEPIENSQLKVFGNFKSEMIEDFDLQTNDGGKAELINRILKLSSSTSPSGYGKAVSKNSYSSPASVKWKGKIISGQRNTYSDVDLLLGGDIWSGGIGFHWNSWYGYMDAIGVGATKSLGDFSGSVHEFRLDISENKIVWFIDSNKVFEQDISSPPGGKIITSAYGAWPSSIGPRTVGSFELSDISITGKQYQFFQPISGKNIFEFTPAEEGDYNLNFFVSINDGRDDSYSVPISISNSILETGSSVINPFSQSAGNSENKNSGSGNSGTDNSKNILPIAVGAAAVGAAAVGGIYLLKGRTKPGRVISGIKSGFTEYGLAQIKRTKDFFAFLQEEINGYWVKKYQAEEEARQEYLRQKQLALERERLEQEQIQMKSFSQTIGVDKNTEQTLWALNQANEAIEMLNSGKGDPGWFRDKMKYLAEQSGNSELSNELLAIASQIKGERVGDKEAEGNGDVEKIKLEEINENIISMPSAYYASYDANYADFEKEDYTMVQQSEPPSFSSALSGTLKALMIWGGNEFAFLGSVVDKLSKGDLFGASSALIGHAFDFASTLLKVSLNHGKEIVGAAIIGLAAGAAIALTGGWASPLVIPLATVGIGIVGMQIFNYYVPALSKLNGDVSLKDILAGNVSEEALSDYNQISEMLLTDTIILAAAIAGAGAGGRIGRFKITETKGEKIITDETTGKAVSPAEFLKIAKQELRRVGVETSGVSEAEILIRFEQLTKLRGFSESEISDVSSGRMSEQQRLNFLHRLAREPENINTINDPQGTKTPDHVVGRIYMEETEMVPGKELTGFEGKIKNTLIEKSNQLRPGEAAYGKDANGNILRIPSDSTRTAYIDATARIFSGDPKALKLDMQKWLDNQVDISEIVFDYKTELGTIETIHLVK